MNQLSVKKRGAHFTPVDIADYIAKYAFDLLDSEGNQRELTILDPACGDGELLIAALRHAKRLGKTVNLIGIDTDSASIESARARILELLNSRDTLDLRCADFLDCKSRLQPDTFDSLLKIDENSVPLADLIIANPPYVRTQVLGAEASQRLARKYRLTGKVDLYHAFFLNYINFLKSSGVLGVITSNRYLYTKSGSIVRKTLSEEFDIDYIVDLGDTKIFSAAVLPALLFGKPKSDSSKKPIKCTRLYEDTCAQKSKQISSVVEMLESRDGFFSLGGKTFRRESGHIRNASFYKEPWILVSSKQESWLDKIDAAAYCRIQDVGKVRVGVKTTADNVFIRNEWESLAPDTPEQQWIHPLISSCDTRRWHINDNTAHSILYPYYVNQGERKVAALSDYPHMKAYLESFYEQLSGRSYVLEANREWYEIWVPQDPSAWESPKVVFPDISNNARFLIDKSGAIVDGNCYWIQLKDTNEDMLYLIAAVANSSIMDKYHSLAFQNVLYSGKRRYLTQYVSKYPIPNPNSMASKEIVAYVKSAIQENSNIDDDYIDNLVSRAFGLS